MDQLNTRISLDKIIGPLRRLNTADALQAQNHGATPEWLSAIIEGYSAAVTAFDFTDVEDLRRNEIMHRRFTRLRRAALTAAEEFPYALTELTVREKEWDNYRSGKLKKTDVTIETLSQCVSVIRRNIAELEDALEAMFEILVRYGMIEQPGATLDRRLQSLLRLKDEIDHIVAESRKLKTDLSPYIEAMRTLASTAHFESIIIEKRSEQSAWMAAIILTGSVAVFLSIVSWVVGGKVDLAWLAYRLPVAATVCLFEWIFVTQYSHCAALLRDYRSKKALSEEFVRSEVLLDGPGSLEFKRTMAVERLRLFQSGQTATAASPTPFEDLLKLAKEVRN